jgi:hypothetical protein
MVGTARITHLNQLDFPSLLYSFEIELAVPSRSRAKTKIYCAAGTTVAGARRGPTSLVAIAGRTDRAQLDRYAAAIESERAGEESRRGEPRRHLDTTARHGIVLQHRRIQQRATARPAAPVYSNQKLDTLNHYEESTSSNFRMLFR